MLKAKRFICFDLGASTVKLAEFRQDKDGTLILERFNYSEISLDPSRAEHHSPVTSEIIGNLLSDSQIRRAPVLVTVPGQSALTRFLKLPAVEETKVFQIIQYEAAQNIPFPMEEVVWDYQLIGGGEGEELEVALVAIKAEIVHELTQAIIGAHLDLQVVDVAPMALYNGVRYNYPEWFSNDTEKTECAMVLDIGARTSNLVFVEKNRIASRVIPIAGNLITQTIAQEFQVSFEEAEKLKREKGMVGLGGAYEDPADETEARIAKIVRNVMTQLHAEINRTINTYRTQRGGKSPTKLLLSGGTSIMHYLDRFFQEAFHIPVEFYNPFRHVRLGAGIARDQLSRCAHIFGETVGVALRRVTECPIEISLMPPDLLKTKEFHSKIPYLAGVGASIILMVACWNLYYRRLTDEIRPAAERLSNQLAILKKTRSEIETVAKQVEEEKVRLERIASIIENRTIWIQILNELNQAISSDPEMWLTHVSPLEEGGSPRPAGPFGAPAAPRAIEFETLIIEGRGIADLVTPGNNSQKAQALAKRLTGDRPGSADSIFARNSAVVDLVVLPPPPTREGIVNHFEQYSYRFKIRLKLKKPLRL